MRKEILKQDSRAIGVFDSGIGGMTVLKELARQLPNERFIYLGDTARLPYGTKSPRTIRKYVYQTLDFLIDKNVKCVVVACNSASTVVNFKSYRGCAIYNVIDPGSEAAVGALKRGNGRIGILATRATVQSGMYPRKIQRLARQASFKSKLSKILCYQNAAPLLVPLVEEGWATHPVTREVIKTYVAPLLKKKIGVLVLGCTHFPLLTRQIQKVVGSKVQLVDSSQTLARALKAEIGKSRTSRTQSRSQQKIEIYLTDDSASFRKLVAQFLKPFPIGRIQVCHL